MLSTWERRRDVIDARSRAGLPAIPRYGYTASTPSVRLGTPARHGASKGGHMWLVYEDEHEHEHKHEHRHRHRHRRHGHEHTSTAANTRRPS